MKLIHGPFERIQRGGATSQSFGLVAVVVDSSDTVGIVKILSRLNCIGMDVRMLKE